MSAYQSPGVPVDDEPLEDEPLDDDAEDVWAAPSDDADDPEPDESLAAPLLLEPSLEPDDSLPEPDDSLPEPAESLPEPAESVPDPSVAEDAFVADELEDERSFFAQPDPLKWIDGAEKALRTGAAPQTGHTVGLSALMPWSTSKRWPLLTQRYS
jgi:hypothetical protein